MGNILRIRKATATVKRTVPAGRAKNSALRVREHLSEAEVERLIAAARKRGRNATRDAAMILLAYRHGLRAGELCGLQWTQVDFQHQRLHVTRLKRGLPATHPLTGSELRALRQLRREHPHAAYIFMSERGAPMTEEGFARMLGRTAKDAGLADLRVHPHMLRHSTGYKLANDGVSTRVIQVFLGHKNIQHTTRYTALAANAFHGLWKD